MLNLIRKKKISPKVENMSDPNTECQIHNEVFNKTKSEVKLTARISLANCNNSLGSSRSNILNMAFNIRERCL